MNQMKTSTILKTATLSLFVFAALSCAPKKQGVRATQKTAATTLNPSSSAIAEQQASSQNAIYKIATISFPTQTDSGISVDSELQMPSGEYLPITTTHLPGQLDSQGTFTDSGRGLQVYVQARCSDATDCAKYILLVTVTRNNQAVYQSGAISFKDDCNFYTSSSSPSTGGMVTSLDSYMSKWTSVQPSGDSSSCLQ